jgi:hypothetical protein
VVISALPIITFSNTTYYSRYNTYSPAPLTVYANGTGLLQTTAEGSMTVYSECANYGLYGIDAFTSLSWTATGSTQSNSASFLTRQAGDLPDGCPLYARIRRFGLDSDMVQVGRELAGSLISLRSISFSASSVLRDPVVLCCRYSGLLWIDVV